MLEKTEIERMVDGEDDITLIDLSEAQYAAYKREADELGVEVHEYIVNALEHEQMALAEGLTYPEED